MDIVLAARSLISDTLAFHLFFVLFGVGLPFLIVILEGYAIWKKKPAAIQVARSWTRALVVLFIAGAISGTIVSLQFSMIWPHFTEFAGKVVGLAFALEGFAFTVEVVFLTVYVLTWDRLKPLWHWLCGLVVSLAALTSALFITSVNAWMNTPTGFKVGPDGQPTDINVHQAIFSPAAGTELSHSILSYIFAVTLIMLGVYAWIYWRRKPNKLAQYRIKQLMLGLAVMAVVFGTLVAATGDRAGKFLAKNEPYKLAAAEGLNDTTKNAPLLIGGYVTGDQIKGAIKVPSLLSFLATGSFSGEVKGLNETPVNERPSRVVHYFFDGMVGIGTVTIIIPAVYLYGRWRNKKWTDSRFIMKLFVACGVLGIIAAELGWMLTEFGRQPYVIRGVMKVSEAVTSNENVIRWAEVFPVLYILLFIFTIKALKRTAKISEGLLSK